ncbi:hypothetical protein GLYMA_03G211133v4 [Glycine max]|nr:hypothetical protein GLYMA_03G211133v4 [Glycine max]KAH1071096.1 hypothetical protein GYH30_007916 [Glycine max]
MSTKLYWCRHVCFVCRCLVLCCKAQSSWTKIIGPMITLHAFCLINCYDI